MNMLVDAASDFSHSSLGDSAHELPSVASLTSLDDLLTLAVQFATVEDRIYLARASKRWYHICTQPSCWSISFQYDSLNKQGKEVRVIGSQVNLDHAGRELQTSPIFKSTKILNLILQSTKYVQQLLDGYHKNEFRFEHLTLALLGLPDHDSVTVFDLRTVPLKSVKLQCSLLHLPKLLLNLPSSVTTLSLIANLEHDAAIMYHVTDDQLVDELTHSFKHLQQLQVMSIGFTFNRQSKKSEIHFHSMWFRTLNQLSKQNPKLRTVLWPRVTFRFEPDVVNGESCFRLPVNSYVCPQIRAISLRELHEAVVFPLKLVDVLFPNLDSLRILDKQFHANTELQSLNPLPATTWKRLTELRLGQESSVTFLDPPKSGLEGLTTFKFENEFSDSVVESFLKCTPNITALSFKRIRLQSFKLFELVPMLQSLEGITWPKDFARRSCEQQYGETVEKFKKRSAAIETPESHASLASYFPNLTSLQCNSQAIPQYGYFDEVEGEATTVFEARFHLQSIPQLRSVRWFLQGDGPTLNPQDFDKYFSPEECLKRNQRVLEQQLDHEDENTSFEIDNGTRQGSVRTARYRGFAQQARTSLSPAPEGADGSVAPMELDDQIDAAARNMTSFNLSLIFQFLPVTDLSRASRVSRTWRSASTSPLVLRHRITVQMDELMGAKVSGPCLRVSSIVPITRAVRSQVLRNIRILILGTHHTDNDQSIRRLLHNGESQFSASYLDVFETVPQFISLHTLAIQWRHYVPTLSDVARVRNVLQSNALKHLKVLRLLGNSLHLQMLLDQIDAVSSVEIVELRYFKAPENDTKYRKFASQLLRLPNLKTVYISVQGQQGRVTTDDDLKELATFCQGIPVSFDELMWRIPLTEEVLLQVAQEHKSGLSNLVFPHLKSIFLPALSNNLSALARGVECFRDLTEISVGEFKKTPHIDVIASTFPTHFVQQLKSFKIFTHHLDDALDLLASLEKYDFPSLRCFHFIIRAYRAKEDGSGRVDAAQTFVERFSDFLNRQKSLQELNLAGHQRKLPRWENFAGRLKVVNFSNEDALLQCNNLVRVTIGLRTPRDRLNRFLLTLPSFEELIIANHSENTVWNRMSLQRIEEQRKQREVAVKSASSQAEGETPRRVLVGKRRKADDDSEEEDEDDEDDVESPLNKSQMKSRRTK